MELIAFILIVGLGCIVLSLSFMLEELRIIRKQQHNEYCAFAARAEAAIQLAQHALQQLPKRGR